MAKPALRIDVSAGQPDLHLLAVEPGMPLLDKTNAVGNLLRPWLGRFAAEPERVGDSVSFFVCDEQGARLGDQRKCRPATKADLQGPLKTEWDGLKDRLQRAKPQTSSERLVHQFLRRDLREPRPESESEWTASACQFYKYQDPDGSWRLLWCCGFSPTSERRGARPVICPKPDCRQLALIDRGSPTRCSRCGSALSRGVLMRRAGRYVAAALVLLLVGAALYAYLRPSAKLAGEVVCAATGQAIADAEVSMDDRARNALCNADGHFLFEQLAAGPATVRATAPGYLEQSVPVELVSHDDTKVDIRLVGAGQVEGRVVWRCGERDVPVPGAQVAMAGADAVAETADDQGAFVLAGLPPGPRRILAGADGFRPAEADVEMPANDPTPLRMVLTPEGQLAGQVVCAIDRTVPIADAEVAVDETGANLRSDAAGRFLLAGIPPEGLSARVSADGFRPSTFHATPRSGSLAVPLTGNATVGGIVIRADSKEPVSGAEVSLADTSRTARTDETGAFRFEGVRSGPITLHASGAGMAASVSEQLPPDEETAVRLELVGGATVRGRVVRALDDEPLEGAVVTTTGSPLEARTDAGGKFTLAGLPFGPATLHARAEGYRPGEMELDFAEGAQTLDQIALVGETAISGVVFDATDRQRTIPGATLEVHVAGYRTKLNSAADGSFHLKNMPSGPIEIIARAPEYREGQVRNPIGPPDTHVQIPVPLNPIEATVSGRVVRAPDKEPIAGATVTVVGTPVRATTDAEGQYTLADVPVGEAKFHVSAEGYLPREGARKLARGPQRLGDVALSPASSMTGRVVGALDGSPISGASVTIAGGEAASTTDRDGRFTLAELPAGEAAVHVSADGYRPRQVNAVLSPGPQKLNDLALEGDTTVKGVVLDADNRQRAIPNATLQIQAGAYRTTLTSSPNGGFTVGNLPAGLVHVTAEAAGHREARVSKRVGPDDPWIEVPMTRLVAVEGLVFDADNRQRPIAGAEVRVSVDGMAQTVKSQRNGRFSLSLPAGRADVLARAEGFCEATLQKQLAGAGTQLEIPMQRGTTVRGTVVNALNNEPVPRADVVVTVGTVRRTVRTDAKGQFVLEGVPAGNASVDISATNFEPLQLTHPTTGGPLRSVLSPDLPPGEARIVLTWGQRPRDLDAHLVGTPSSGPRVHINYANRTGGGCTLDLDAKEGEGPETITVRGGPGTYRYYVVHPENLGTSDGAGLARSGAQVRVYFKGAPSRKPHVMPSKAGGPVWHVFDMVIDSNRGIKIVPQNRWFQEVPDR